MFAFAAFSLALVMPIVEFEIRDAVTIFQNSVVLLASDSAVIS